MLLKTMNLGTKVTETKKTLRNTDIYRLNGPLTHRKMTGGLLRRCTGRRTRPLCSLHKLPG